MRVVFRVDASNYMGTGHLMRCLTLAEALRKRGCEVRFICREHPGNLIEQLQHRAMPTVVLHIMSVREPLHTSDYGAWLGASQAQDAEQTILALDGKRPDWLIADHYSLDAEWEQMLRPHVNCIMVIDDLANRPHDCDLLLDQNFALNEDTRYEDKIPASCQYLAGPRYALLRPEYSIWRNALKSKYGSIQRILVFLGGIDPHNVTGMALKALSNPEFSNIQIDVVVGANNPHRDSIEAQATQRPLTKIHGSRSHLADLMSHADLAIGAGGATTWERFCLRLPTLVVSIADNQKPACIALSQKSLIHYVGDAATIDVQQLYISLKEIINQPDALATYAREGQVLVDGLGTLRVVEALMPTTIDQLILRPAQEDDAMLYFNWANEPEVRRQAINSNPIQWSQHKHWFLRKIADPKSYLYVLQAGELPVGQIRFDLQHEEALIDYALDPLVRGRGWATCLVVMGAQLLRANEPLILRAEVKTGNPASRAVFKRLGFLEYSESNMKGMHVFRLPSSQIGAVGLRLSYQPF